MISGVDLGRGKDVPSQVKVQASSFRGGQLEVWLDDLQAGRKIATIPVPAGSGDSWINCSASISHVSGSHDVFVKFPAGSERAISIKNIQFVKK
jgi:hypothetical protein